MVPLIFLFLNRVASHAKRSLSPQFETSQIGPGSIALEICLQSLYWRKICHTYLSMPFNIGPVVPSWRPFSSPNRSPGVRQEIPPTEQDAITMRMHSHLMMAQRETYKVKLTKLQAEFACMLSRGHKAPFKWP
jgi:hypothetical protein